MNYLPFLKFLLPRRWQIFFRRRLVRYQLRLHGHDWPISENAKTPPDQWTGWPEKKRFALVLTHDVEKAGGLQKCYQLAEIEENLGFRSSFNFVSGDYTVPAKLRRHLTDHGFEIGVHGLHHNGNPFRSIPVFQKQAIEINRYLREWGSVGFRSPSMYHDLTMLHQLDIEYDASTFDTDPFEPQPDGMGTIFPFWVQEDEGQKGYVELPYTLPQDFLLFILMEEKNTDIWKKKLAWIVDNGGMALLNVHPDYIYFDKQVHREEYPVAYYEDFLKYIKSSYEGQYWHALPRCVSRYWSSHKQVPTPISPETISSLPIPLPVHEPIHTCMVVHSFYESDNRVMRYAEALVKRGDSVDVIALGKEGTPRYETIRGVNVYRIQRRGTSKIGKLSYVLKLVKFMMVSCITLSIHHIKKNYDVIHVHNMPDFLVFTAVFPKMRGTKVILDIHDIVPELYATLFDKNKNSFQFKLLVAVERASCAFSDHVIIANDIWHKLITTRSVGETKCSIVLNYPDENVFFKRPRVRSNHTFIMIYPGSLNRRQGVDIAIRAFALIKDRIPKTEFHIYGEGTDRHYLERLAIELGLAERVLFNDSLPIYDVADRMADADLAIEPKRNDMFAGDAMSTKILEFMSLGIPIIASDTRVHKYYFDESVVQFFKSDDERDLAKCMLLLIENPDLRRKMLLNSEKFVRGFEWNVRKKEYFEIIDRLAKR